MHDLSNVCLSEIITTRSLSTVVLVLVDTVQPHETTKIECEDTIVVSIHRMSREELPYFIGEIAIKQLSPTAAADALRNSGYSFADERGDIWLPEESGIWRVSFEGDICGEIFCKSVRLDPEPGGGAKAVHASPETE
jgi:hypothetical protein